jgi:hypothetical protein
VVDIAVLAACPGNADPGSPMDVRNPHESEAGPDSEGTGDAFGADRELLH